MSVRSEMQSVFVDPMWSDAGVPISTNPISPRSLQLGKNGGSNTSSRQTQTTRRACFGRGFTNGNVFYRRDVHGIMAHTTLRQM